jgi:hypothetical protein
LVVNEQQVKALAIGCLQAYETIIKSFGIELLNQTCLLIKQFTKCKADGNILRILRNTAMYRRINGKATQFKAEREGN